MSDKIIALVDGSAYSASVCEHAAWVAERSGWAVEVLHILGRRETAEKADYSGSIALGARTALLEELAELDAQRARLVTHRGRAILEDARAILDRAGINEINTRLRQGDIVDTVAEQEAGAEMILIGKRGEAADFATGHLGSNLERIVRASRKPVVIAARAFRPIAKVLVAFDGGASAHKAIAHIAQSPVFQGLAVHVVTVGDASAEMTQALHTARATLEGAGLATETSTLPGQPEATIGKLVEDASYDMLVMGAYGHSRIRTCKVPVMLMR